MVSYAIAIYTDVKYVLKFVDSLLSLRRGESRLPPISLYVTSLPGVHLKMFRIDAGTNSIIWSGMS